LIDKGKPYFLSRPRRFGKSLAVTTFEALFSGRKELFEGLAAEAFMNRPDYQQSPVIRLDMSMVTTDSGMDDMRKSIKRQVLEVANIHDARICPNMRLFGGRDHSVFSRLSERYCCRDENIHGRADCKDVPVLQRLFVRRQGENSTLQSLLDLIVFYV